MNRDLQLLRNELKRRRRSLDTDAIATASQKVAATFWNSAFAQRINNLGIYMATAGEINCEPIIHTAWMRKKRVFAPILHAKRLKFALLDSATKLTRNKFDILEPVYSKTSTIHPRRLDAVIVPLLAFDDKLNRLGMGAGYYDRSFAFSKQQGAWHRPLLVGAAYSFQKVDNLRANPWDVPLHVVITENECIRSY